MINTEDTADKIIKQISEYGDIKLIQTLYNKLAVLIKEEGIVVRYTGEMSPSQKEKVQRYISKKISAEAPVSFIRDDDLEGGIVIEYKDYLIDYSLKTKIGKLKSTYGL